MTPEQREHFRVQLLTLHLQEDDEEIWEYIDNPDLNLALEDLAYFASQVIQVRIMDLEGEVAGAQTAQLEDAIRALNILIDKGFDPRANLRAAMGDLADENLPDGVNNILELAACAAEKEIFRKLLELGVVIEEGRLENLRAIILSECGNEYYITSAELDSHGELSLQDFPMVPGGDGAVRIVDFETYCSVKDNANFMNILARKVNEALLGEGLPLCDFYDVEYIKENFLAQTVERSQNIFSFMGWDFNDLTNPAPELDQDIIEQIKQGIIQDRNPPAPDVAPAPVGVGQVAGGGVGHAGPAV